MISNHMNHLTNLHYKTYYASAQYVSYLLTPATVSLAIPLYLQLERLKKNGIEVICLNKHRGFDVKIIFKLAYYFKKIKPNVIHTHLSALQYVSKTIVFVSWYLQRCFFFFASCYLRFLLFFILLFCQIENK